MSLIASDKGGSGDFEPVPEGTYIARCISVIDLGLQDSGQWGPKEKIYIGFEVPEVRVKWNDQDGNEQQGAALIGQLYTNSLNEKANLRRDLQTWRGKAFTAAELEGFDVRAILGAPAMISVTHNTKGDKTYANIASIVRPPKGTALPDAEGEPLTYSAEDGDTDAFDKLPEWIRKKIEAGQALRASQSENPAPPANGGKLPPGQGEQYSGTDFEDDIPF